MRENNSLEFRQVEIEDAPDGYDMFKSDIPHGEMKMISYKSITVGVNRNAMVYTPQIFQAK